MLSGISGKSAWPMDLMPGAVLPHVRSLSRCGKHRSLPYFVAVLNITACWLDPTVALKIKMLFLCWSHCIFLGSGIMLSIDEDVGMVSVSMRSAHMGAYSRTDRTTLEAATAQKTKVVQHIVKKHSQAAGLREIFWVLVHTKGILNLRFQRNNGNFQVSHETREFVDSWQVYAHYSNWPA